LIFDDGNFSEDIPFTLFDFLTHARALVLGRNFRLEPEIFSHVLALEKHIFQGPIPGPADDGMPDKPRIKKSKLRFTHQMLDQKPLKFSGEVRITDGNNFPPSKTVSTACVTTKPGGIREMHWHPIVDEWSFFILGSVRIRSLKRRQ